MVESPERKVLKDVLVNLKVKIINSENIYATSAMNTSLNITETLKAGIETVNKMADGEEKNRFLLIIAMFKVWEQNFALLNVSATSLLSDLTLYIGALEKYSSELDNTLRDIFAQAVAQAKNVSEQKLEQLEEQKRKMQPYTA